MNRYIYFIFSFFVVVSCTSEEPPELVQAANDVLIIGNPMDYGLDSLTIFPVGMSYNPIVIEKPTKPEQIEGKNGEKIMFFDNTLASTSTINFSQNEGFKKYDSQANIEFVNGNQSDFDILNLIFYNLISGESYPLVYDSIHILSFAVHKEFENPMIFYRVVKEDYNSDLVYNGFDPVILYISNLDGSEFTQITPTSEYFIDYTIYSQTNSILIKTSIDSNKDYRFLNDDETNFRSMKLDDPKFAENIFEESLKDRLRDFN